MASYGQFCAVARAIDLLGERWTLLVVRELLLGSRRFTEIRRGIPRISRTMLSERLRAIVDAQIAVRRDDDDGPVYELTEGGRELFAVVGALGHWGQRWLPRDLPKEEIDGDALVWDMRRRVDEAALPKEPIVVRIELSGVGGRAGTRFLLLRRDEVSLCTTNPGFPDVLHVRAPARALTLWWRGDLTFEAARAAGLTLEGPREYVRAFPRWFRRYLFADVPPASAKRKPKTGSPA